MIHDEIHQTVINACLTNTWTLPAEGFDLLGEIAVALSWIEYWEIFNIMHFCRAFCSEIKVCVFRLY